jgi:CRP-like cAMP-binding protein
MTDEFRPLLLPTAQVRARSDGTEGIYDAETGRCLETAPDQANLVQLCDGTRSLLEISAEFLSRYGFVPFAALTDLIRALARAQLLANPPAELERMGLSDFGTWADLFSPSVLWRRRARAPLAMRVFLVAHWVALAAFFALKPTAPLSPLDVGLVYVGASMAMMLRGGTKALVCALFGHAPQRFLVTHLFGLLYAEPDHRIAALLDRRPRALAHLAALVGVGCAVLIGTIRPGLQAGAMAVLVVDLCPFIASSGGSLLALLAGRANLREHVRAYLGRQLGKRLLSLRRLRADRDLLVTSLLSLAWGAWGVALTITLGLSTSTQLIELGIRSQGARAAVAYGGAMVLFIVCPLLLLMLFGKVLEEFFSFLWAARASGGKRAEGTAYLEAFRSIPLFSKLSDADLLAMAAEAREVTYEPGHAIVQQGTKGETFYSVRSGVVAIESEDQAQRTRVVARLAAGDCFGETALVEDGLRTATVRAMTETVVVELGRAAFDKVAATVGGVDFGAVLRAASAVGKSKVFRDLPAERRSALAMKFVPRSVAAATDVVRFGEKGDEFYLVAQGELEVLDANGVTLTRLGAGDHFGEIALLRNVPRTATVRTTADSLLLVLSREIFLGALTADLALSERVEQIARMRSSPQLTS